MVLPFVISLTAGPLGSDSGLSAAFLNGSFVLSYSVSLPGGVYSTVWSG